MVLLDQTEVFIMALPDAVTAGLMNIGTTPAVVEALKNSVGAADDGIAGATFTVSGDVGDAVTVNVQLLKENGDDLDSKQSVLFILFDDANGDTIFTAPSSWDTNTDGTVVELANGSAIGICEADGDIDPRVTLLPGSDQAFLGILTTSGKLIISPALDWIA